MNVERNTNYNFSTHFEEQASPLLVWFDQKLHIVLKKIFQTWKNGDHFLTYAYLLQASLMFLVWCPTFSIILPVKMLISCRKRAPVAPIIQSEVLHPAKAQAIVDCLNWIFLRYSEHFPIIKPDPHAVNTIYPQKHQRVGFEILECSLTKSNISLVEGLEAKRLATVLQQYIHDALLKGCINGVQQPFSPGGYCTIFVDEVRDSGLELSFYLLWVDNPAVEAYIAGKNRPVIHDTANSIDRDF